MNNRKNTSEKSTSEKYIVSGTKRFAIGAASVLAATALVGVGAQGAFAASSDHTPAGSGSGSGSSSASASAGTRGAHAFGSSTLSLDDLTRDLGAGSPSAHLDGAKAQALAKKLAGDSALFSLLPSSLQRDVTTLKDASPSERTADAKKIVSTALDGGYGSAIKSLATHLRDARETSSWKSIARGVGHDFDASNIGGTGAEIATTVTGDAQLFASLPTALQSDLTALSKAPSSEQTADVVKIATTAIAGGYGATIQKVADQLQSGIASTR
ncbi:hypothetical protein [Leifsonia sp. NPDC058248]|uniref:hypothetical protein n=1 Tax=Leifsonia sp. NPDC058248 TaxID=3346402 RepID=UPI0036DB9DB8